MKVVLVGYMASGKSTVGQLLAKVLDAPFVDLDDYIEEEMGMSIGELFSKKGEIFFRKTEFQLLGKVLEESKDIILATGGGTPCYGNNMQTISKNSNLSVYLHLSIPSLVDRISREKDKRPLVKNLKDENLPEFIGKHLFERRSYYAQADVTINCDGKSIEEVVTEIQSHYSK
ncbi:shikimate kinase [Flagellimonas allohymeniacidonis]|uniref:Shikimate kinase n=1 Tax=Flagellimonas allohymeniacidonis TaxID=2517819 RepID=A0A4Q8QEF0_9FLAO|nr:shikimate kinase [Allomuricauda hymeniacidonis]TAI46669.1 shikimate kinase [Allomuricauda hymeniacidonis]